MNKKQEKLYKELSKVLNNFEEMKANEEDLYNMLLKLKDNWKTIIANK